MSYIAQQLHKHKYKALYPKKMIELGWEEKCALCFLKKSSQWHLISPKKKDAQ